MTECQTPASDRGRSVTDRAGLIGFVLSAACLIFLSGLLAAIADLPPTGLVRDATLAAQTLMDRQRLLGEAYSEWLWSPVIHVGDGLVRHDESKAFPGYTVYTSGHGGVAMLLDMQGHEVHRWEAPFTKIWPNARHVSGVVSDRAIHFRRVHIEPNGDLIALYETPIDTPFGYGLCKLDRNSKPIWTYDANAHHDFSVGPDGRIYVLIQEIRTSKMEGWGDLRTPFLEEFVAILSPEGRELKRISLFDALTETPYLRLRTVPATGDVIHSNTVHVVGEKFAAHHAGVSAGDLMVCLRNLHLTAIVSPDSGKVVWATTGPWHFPHDPDPLDNGRIMIFDNIFADGPRAGSRVIEFDPLTQAIDWAYSGSDDEPFVSDVRAASQLLPNGNVLIAESDRGRIFEVTRRGEIVWEFINPVRGGENKELVPIVCGVARCSFDELPFVASRQVASSKK